MHFIITNAMHSGKMRAKTKTTEHIYERLFRKYGNLGWWPAETPEEVVIGAILTQNTSWTNVEKSIKILKDHDLITLSNLASAKLETIKDCIKSSGFFNQKAVRLKNVSESIISQYRSLDGMKKASDTEISSYLLSIKGIGEETMESIMLYALSRNMFVMDKYTYRIFQRIGFPASVSRKYLREKISDDLGGDIEKMKNYHAMLVYLGKDHCKTKPLCNGCPLTEICDFYAESIVP